MLRFVIFLIAIYLLNFTAASARYPEYLRAPANDTLLLSKEDQEVERALKYILNIYCRYAYRIESRASKNAIEFHLYYHPSDTHNVIGYASNRAQSIRTLLNEMSISLEEKKAIRERRVFKIEDRKLVFIRFIKEAKD